MKKVYLLLLSSLVLLASCQKSISDFDPSQQPAGAGVGSGGFEATIDGKKYTFTIAAATLMRSAAFNEKRLDIAGISTDNSKRLIITLGEETSQGNGITVKTYKLNPFPDDDPATPAVDESLTTEGFSTYSTSLGSNNWLTSVYDENGNFIVTSCDANAKTISGTFSTTLTDLLTNSVVKITGGKITSVSYTVLN